MASSLGQRACTARSLSTCSCSSTTAKRVSACSSTNCISSATASWHSAQTLGSDHGPVKLRAVVADDRHLVPACQTHGCQPTGERPHFLIHLAPGAGLPDAEIFFTHGDLMGMLLRTVEQQFGKRIEATVMGHRE